MSLLDRILPRRDERYADRLFETLCSAHALERADQRLLLAIADRSRVVRAAEVFVRPTLFDRSPDRSRWSTKDVDRLAAKLFDRTMQREESLDEPATAESSEDAESKVAADPDRSARRIRWRRTPSKPARKPQSPTAPEPAAIQQPAAPRAAEPKPPRTPIELETIEDPPGLVPTLRE